MEKIIETTASEQTILPFTGSIRLEELEDVIDRGLQGFRKAGEALKVIKSEKLYRDNYSTYKEYCMARWGFTPQYANNLINAANIIDTMEKSETIVSVLPQSENQARALLKLDNPAEEWKQIQQSTGKEQPTAKEIVSYIKMKDVDADIIDAEIEDEVANAMELETASSLLEKTLDAPYKIGSRSGRPQISIEVDDECFDMLTNLGGVLNRTKTETVVKALVFLKESLDSSNDEKNKI